MANNRTKIVATVGPSTESEEMLGKLVDSGANVFRLNLKHNTIEWHSSMIQKIRKVSSRKNANIGILLDLKGPEITIGTFRKGSISLSQGQKVTLTDAKQGDDNTIILNNLGILRSLRPGHRFFMDDGNIEFEVLSSKKNELYAKVVRGGILSDNKSVNFPDIELDVPVLVEQDLKYVNLGMEHDVDFLALSFVSKSSDIVSLRKILDKKKSGIHIIAKIERPQAVENFDSILSVSDGIMIGRGDLGVEIPLPQVPLVQKEIIRKCRESGKPVITATQMLESMVSSQRPTRAEVSDVANAIIDGTDAIMLSAESASGAYPKEAVEMMAQIDSTVREKSMIPHRLGHQKPSTTTEAISQAVDTLSHFALDFKAIVLLTETGRTARAISKFRPQQPIFAITRSPIVANQLSLVWGVESRVMKIGYKDSDGVFRQAMLRLKEEKLLSKGDSVLCVCGSLMGRENLTNTVTISKVE